MVAVHEHMYRSDSYDAIRVDDYLPPLIDGVRTSFAKPVAITLQLAPAILDRDHALPFALICNEVIANAIKHGFPDDRDGEIAVLVEELDPKRAKLTIRDNGVGYDPGATSKGMGKRLVRGLAAQLDASATVDFDRGTVFSLEFAVKGFGKA
jgi:two-component sensor histidine kinase